MGRKKILKKIVEVHELEKDNEFQTERAHLIPSRMNGKRSTSGHIWSHLVKFQNSKDRKKISSYCWREGMEKGKSK